ncbi:Cytolysin B transport protein [Carnobacterium maltaromaticum]|nr:Cytolysin B transport protein [Carnobacterium maltaromaticum]
MYITTKRTRKYQQPKLNPVLKELVKNNKKNFIKTFFIFLVIQCISIYIPYAIRWIIDGEEKDMRKIIFYASFLISSYFIANVFRTKLIVLLQTSTDKDLLSRTIIQLLDLPYSYFVNRSKGELIYRINSNAYIRQILIDQVINTVIDLFFFAFYLIVMWTFNKTLTIITIFIAIVTIFFSYLNTKIMKKIAQNEMVVLTNSQELINEMVNNIFTIKSTNSQKNMYEKWEKNYDEQIIYEKEKAKYNSFLANIPQTIQTFYSLIIYAVGYFLIINSMTTIGNIVAFSTIGISFLTPITSILNSYTQFQTVKVYLDRLFDILETKSESSLLGNEELKDYSGDVTIKDVMYKYSSFSEEAIKNISLTIKPRQKVAIVGASGSGKSTLLKVVAGLYQSSKGNIYYGNQNIKDLDIHKLRDSIGVVLQENVLFNGTFRENITMGRNHTDKEITEIIKAVGLSELVSSFPLALETQISELGQNMSGGQRQKVSIARTIITKPKIIFLDEPTSALDNISENVVMNCLFNIDTTLIVVAHRLSTIQNFDKIVVMDKGEVVGVGNHAELLNTNKYYQNLYQ